MSPTRTMPVQDAAGRPGSPTASPQAALPVLLAGTFMIVMDFFIVNVAFPAIQSRLHAGASAVEWIVTGYGLAFASFLIMAGRLGDHLGRRRVLAAGLLIFVLCSAACGLAPSAQILVAARVVQGLAAAMISPNVLALIGVLYTGAARARAVGAYAAVLGAAAVSGQLIGGLLIAWNLAGLGWRTIFFINVPAGLAALALLPRLVPESRAEHVRRLDLPGIGLVTASLTALVLPLVQGPQAGWPAWTWLSLGLAVPVLVLFAAHQRWLRGRGGDPLFAVELLRQRSFALGLLAQVVLWCSVASFFFVLAFYLQRGRGLDALQAGSVFTILAAAYLAASLRAPALALRFRRAVIMAGAVILAIGLAVLATVTAAGPAGPLWELAPGLLLAGAGQGLTIGPLVTTVLSHAGPGQAGTVSGLLSTMQQVGNALGVAATGIVFYHALHGGYAHAFAASLIQLACLPAVVIALAALLPPAKPTT
jgi:EmrB/QacA subfamily drug resistance transporter